MLRLISPIEVYIKIMLDVTEGGRKQVRCIRQAGPVSGFEYSGIQGFSVHQWGETVNGWTPTTNHVHILRAHLYWQPDVFGPKTRLAVQHKLSHWIKGLIDGDSVLRTTILTQLPGTGWYLYKDKLN